MKNEIIKAIRIIRDTRLNIFNSVLLVFSSIISIIVNIKIQINDFFESQFYLSYIFCIVTTLFIDRLVLFLKLSNISKYLIIVIFNCWFCIFPPIFYGFYVANPSNFAFDNDYLKLKSSFNKSKIMRNDSLFFENDLIIQNDILKSNFRNIELPKDYDTLIFLKNYIILSPKKYQKGENYEAGKLQVYSRKYGKLLFEIPKKENLLESFDRFRHNLKFKVDIIKEPINGINFFDFWCSSVVGFKDNLIKPLRNWILLLIISFTTLIFIPAFELVKNNIFKKGD